MVSSFSSQSRKSLRNLVSRAQNVLGVDKPGSPLSTRFRDAFFYLLAESWISAVGLCKVQDLLELCGFSADEDAKNTVSELLADPLYKDVFYPNVAEMPDPETIGWLYQYWNGAARDSVTWAVSRGEQDGLHHETITLATQIYTESYMADFLVQQVLEGHEEGTLTHRSVLDPACGSGHILLSVCDALEKKLGEEFVPWLLSGMLHGVDIDPTAVSIARLSVLLLIAQRAASFETLLRVAGVLAQTLRVVSAPLGTLCRKSSFEPAAGFDVVITNPPYIGRRKLHTELREYLSKHYPTAAGDLAFAFTIRCIELLKVGGHLALVTNDKWIRLRAYQEMRWSTATTPGIFSHLTVHSLVELGGRAFHKEADLHDGVGVALLHASNVSSSSKHSVRYVDLTEVKNAELKAARLHDNDVQSMQIEQQRFSSSSVGALLLQSVLPNTGRDNGWEELEKRAAVVVGIQTNDDRRFVSPQWLVPVDSSGWVVHHRGGGVQKWYGLNRWMLHLDGVRSALRTSDQGRFPVEEWFSKEGWTYSWFASGTLALRKKEASWSFGRAAASGVFVDDVRVVGFLNSTIGSRLASKLSGKVQLPEGVVRGIPLPNDLSAISPQTVTRLLEVQQILVAQDPREVTFTPSRLEPPPARLALEREYFACTALLEEQAYSAAEQKREGVSEFSTGCDLGFESARDVRIVDTLERLSKRAVARPERLLSDIATELGILPHYALQILLDLLESDIRAERAIWTPFLLEKIHFEVLARVGHRWRGQIEKESGGFMTLSFDDIAAIVRGCIPTLIDTFGVPEFVVTEFLGISDHWMRNQFQSYHQAIFSGHPILIFTSSGVSHFLRKSR